MNALQVLLASFLCLRFERIFLFLFSIILLFNNFEPFFLDACSVKFAFTDIGQKFCSFMAFVLLYFFDRSYLPIFIAIIGSSVASDLFHMYIWLEIFTVSFLFIQKDQKIINLYWFVQLILSILILWSTLYCYNCTGSLTIPLALSDYTSANIWAFFWLLKCGFPWIVVCYQDIQDQHISYMSCITKIGIVAASKALISPYLGVFFVITGIFMALSQIDYKHVLCGHIINQVGIILVALYIDIALGTIYLIYATLIKAILFQVRNCGRLSSLYILALAGLPPNLIFFIKLQLASMSLWGLFPLFSSFFTLFSLKKFILEGEDNFNYLLLLVGINLTILIYFLV